MMKEIENLIDEIYEVYEKKSISCPDELMTALEAVENDEIQGSDSSELNIIGNFDTDDGVINRVIEELYDLALERAELWEFAKSLEDVLEGEKRVGPVLTVRAGRVRPVWDGERLVMEGVDEDIDAEIYTGPTPAPELVMELIDEYVEGR